MGTEEHLDNGWTNVSTAHRQLDESWTGITKRMIRIDDVGQRSR